ncbi:hypothetical protein CPC08DRAFT_824807 [Agrocybe pediades]|nr:hypothetical protein CPC08DRAFT_824807 [Agrocybe pediades]
MSDRGSAQDDAPCKPPDRRRKRYGKGRMVVVEGQAINAECDNQHHTVNPSRTRQQQHVSARGASRWHFERSLKGLHTARIMPSFFGLLWMASRSLIPLFRTPPPLSLATTTTAIISTTTVKVAVFELSGTVCGVAIGRRRSQARKAEGMTLLGVDRKDYERSRSFRNCLLRGGWCSIDRDRRPASVFHQF